MDLTVLSVAWTESVCGEREYSFGSGQKLGSSLFLATLNMVVGRHPPEPVSWQLGVCQKYDAAKIFKAVYFDLGPLNLYYA